MARLTVPQLMSLRENTDNDGLHLSQEEAIAVLAAAELHVRGQRLVALIQELRKENPGTDLLTLRAMAATEIGDMRYSS